MVVVQDQGRKRASRDMKVSGFAEAELLGPCLLHLVEAFLLLFDPTAALLDTSQLAGSLSNRVGGSAGLACRALNWKGVD